MNVRFPFKIIGSGIYLPGNPVDNEELEIRYGVPATYSSQRSGVEKRYISDNESGGEMGAQALKYAIENAGIKVEEIDLLISAGASFDYIIPNQAVIIKSFVSGSEKCHFPVMSINSVCSGFISAIDMAAHRMNPDTCRTVAIVNSEICHRYINPANHETASLFGDAAAAVIIRYDPSFQSGLIKSQFRTYSEGAYHTIIEGGANKFPVRDYPYDPKLHGFKMDGIPLLKMAKKYIPPFMEEFFRSLPIEMNDLDFLLAHQASKTGLELFKKMFHLAKYQVPQNLHKYGNCISASIPLLIHELNHKGKLLKGKNVLLSGTSAGFSISATLIRI